MVNEKNITIIGAGPAGLVTAINLNREGFDVIVHEKQDSVGGDPGWHPSIHTTPVAVPGLYNYIGIDCSDAFVNSTDVLKIYMGSKEIDGVKSIFGKYGMSNVERGHRISSLDNFLFRIAKKEGVKFEFNHPFTKEDFLKAPKGTIIATGLSPGVYEWLGIDYTKFSGYWAYTEVENDFISNTFYFGTFSNEYGYTCSLNGIWYVLLFARKGISQENLQIFKKELERMEGRTFENWNRFLGHTPKGPRLFFKDFILAGTFAGFIEPAFGGGITGALISGKIAAMAVTNPEKAEIEFNRFTVGIKKIIDRKRKGRYNPSIRMGDTWFKF